MNDLNQPIILREGAYSQENVRILRDGNKIWQENDIYKAQLEELFEILNPTLVHAPNFSTKRDEFVNSKLAISNSGNWIYFPWNGHLVHVLNEEDYFALRTNRNKLIIKKEEQEKLYNSCLGFVGLSIGSHFAISHTYSGFSKKMKLADFDSLSTSNLNRVRTGIKDIGTSKTTIIRRQIYDINPYAELEFFENGLKGEALNQFFQGEKLQLIFEAIDDFEMKIRLRIKAREERVPVIMLTNLGDSMLIDVERYDENPKTPLFNGMIGNTPEEILNSEITEKKKVEYAMRIVGIDHLSARIFESLFEINKTLVGRPQVFSTVSSTGGFSAYLTRKLILNNTLKSGRYYISFDNIVNIPVSEEEVLRSEMYLAKLKENLGE